MRSKPLILALLAGLALSGAAQATLIDRGGGLIYDSGLDITWLKDANLAATSSFGVPGINANGWMNWFAAQSWIDAMNTAHYLGYSDWRLPTMVDTLTPGCDYAYGGTDCGYNVQTASGGITYSELAYMYYSASSLDNKAYYDTSGNPQPGFGLVDDPLNPNDESLFTNIQPAAPPCTGRGWSTQPRYRHRVVLLHRIGVQQTTTSSDPPLCVGGSSRRCRPVGQRAGARDLAAARSGAGRLGRDAAARLIRRVRALRPFTRKG